MLALSTFDCQPGASHEPRPFPTGLRFVAGNVNASAAEFLAASETGWECGASYHNADIPTQCPAGCQLNVRYQAPSCWDGIHLDTPDHKSHMAYPVDDRCPMSHPVAVPMIEFKMAFPSRATCRRSTCPAGADTRGTTTSSTRGSHGRWLRWSATVLINGGLQCDARGYDQFAPERGAALNENYELP